MSATVERPRERGDCPECGGDVAPHGEAVCGDCGLVLDDRPDLDRGVPRSHQDDARRHHGMPRTVTRHDRGLGGQVIGYKDAGGRSVESPRLSRLRREQRRAAIPSKRERNLVYALVETRRMATALDQSGGIEKQACRLVETAQEAGLWLGRSIEGMAAAGLLAALRVNGRPYTADDLAAVAKCEAGDIAGCYKTLNRELSLPAPPPTAAQHVPRIASEAGLSDRDEAAALELARRVDDEATGGRSPSGLAAACCYIASGMAAAPLAEAANVTDTTIYSTARYIEGG